MLAGVSVDFCHILFIIKLKVMILVTVKRNLEFYVYIRTHFCGLRKYDVNGILLFYSL